MTKKKLGMVKKTLKPGSEKKPAPKRENTFAKVSFFPLTKQREVAAAGMGLKFGFVLEYKPQYYFRDTIIVLWLRTIPAESGGGWSVDRAEENPKAAAQAAYEWAARMGIAIDSPGFSDAWEIFRATMVELQNAKGIPIIPDDEKKEDSDTGEL